MINNYLFGLLVTFCLVEAIIIIYLWFRTIKKWNSRECRDSLCNKAVIDMMKKSRHDMLNNIQVISCYATLKRNEDIINYINIINYNAKQQSLIAAFSNDKIAVYLYKIHALFPNVIIELEIEEGIAQVRGRLNHDLFLNVLDNMIDTLYQVVDKRKEQHLIISIESNETDSIINIEFEGNVNTVYNKIAKIEKLIIKNEGKFDIGLNTEQKFIVDLHLPLKKFEV